MGQASVVLFGIEDERNANWIKNNCSNQIKDEFVAVTLKTKDDERLGPIIIYIDVLRK
ncbi:MULTISPECIES: hypothetical protein [unclassified Paenibacillus]|uniref:hypothetical protein n=1 Tax=unclassified Paenibacillus TaxID=185978 RepID=UPI0030F59738